MSTNGGNGNGGGEGAAPTFDEALASMPTADRVDRLAVFTVTEMRELARLIAAQTHSAAEVMKSQADATIRMTELLGERIARLEVEVGVLRAEVRDRDAKGRLQ